MFRSIILPTFLICSFIDNYNTAAMDWNNVQAGTFVQLDPVPVSKYGTSFQRNGL